MRKLLLSAAVLAVTFAQGQSSLFLENFESGGGTFNLNTSTLGGQVGLNGDNAWVINNAYTGGSGTSSCFGFGFSLGNTPDQPAGISASPNSNYLHILSDDGTNNGILNANYVAADGSFCFFAQSHFVEMNSDINTTGYTNVTLDFWWMCFGDVNAYGQLYYSTNSGGSWTQVTNPINSYYGVSTWTNQVISDPAWDNQPNLRFAYRFVNNTATAGGDPSFSIDDVEVFGTLAGANTLTTGTSLTPTNWCFNTAQNINVDFTSTGTFTAGNIYTAQLSDASGSFAAPTAIGTLNSTANSGTINATVPAGTAVGSGYRIRVVSSNPATTGSDNGADFTIHALPNVTLGSFSAVCQNDAPFTLTGGSPAGGTFSGTGVTANVFNPSSAGAGTHTITYSYTDGNSCSASAQQPITVNSCASLEELDEVFSLYPNPAYEFFKLNADLAIEKVELVDLNGKLLKTYPVSDNYGLENVTSGTYIVIIYTETGNYKKRLTVK